MLQLDRRRLLQLGRSAPARWPIPGTAAALATARGFTHNVASGEPGYDKVMLWTRFVPAAAGMRSSSTSFRTAPNSAGSRPGRGDCGSGTRPLRRAGRRRPATGQWYFYRFRGPDGSFSPIARDPAGRAAGDLHHRHLSCANLPFGWFNAYAHAAERRDIDLILHVGDYLYEYQRAGIPRPARRWPAASSSPRAKW